MREFKFRICYTAQNGEKRLIYDDNRFLIGLDGKIYENYGMDWNHSMWEGVFDTEPPILQQCTGAKDKTGKEIWEGDILKYQNRTGTVRFFAAMFIVDWGDQTDSELSYLMINDMEVIGNEFEYKK